jgi:hypothetical protein
VDPFLHSGPISLHLHGFHSYDFTSARSDTLAEDVFLLQAEQQVSADASKNCGSSHFRVKQYTKGELLTMKIEEVSFFEMAVTISRHNVAQKTSNIQQFYKWNRPPHISDHSTD